MTATYSPVAPILRARMAGVRALVARAHAAGVPAHLCLANDPASGYSDAVIGRVVLGLAVQLQRDVAPEYKKLPPVVQMLGPGEVPPPDDPERVVATIAIVATIPSDPTAQGWHQPIGAGGYGVFDGFVSTEGLDIDGVSECIGHELVETFVDPTAAVMLPQADGSQVPQEPGDACQAGGPTPNALRVAIELNDGGNPVMGPNWCLSGWGVIGHRGKKDWLNLLPQDQDAPIGPHGYVARRSADGTEVDVFGADGERVQLPAEKLHPEARIQVRMAVMRGATEPAGPPKVWHTPTEPGFRSGLDDAGNPVGQ